MTIRENYHHGDLHQAILDAACEHLRTKTADSLSLRALARVIGVSQTAPYRHFDSRNALFAGIARWGFAILEEDLREVMANASGTTLELTVELGLAYIRFSRKHFEKYRLCYDSSLVEFDEYPELQEASLSSLEVLLTVLRKGKEEGIFLDRPDEELVAMVWSGLHGIASLLQVKAPTGSPEDGPSKKAVAYLDNSSHEALTLLLRSIQP